MDVLARRTLWALNLALLVAAISIGQAAAADPPRSATPNDRAGALGVGAVSVSGSPQRVVAPNDRGGRLGVGASAPVQSLSNGAGTDRRSPDTLDAAASTQRLPGSHPTGDTIRAAHATALARATSFDWADAGIGAGLAGAALALLAGLAIAVSSRNRHSHA